MSTHHDSGQPSRVEDIRLLTGRARFTDDIHLDRMVQAAFVRSPEAHAEIVSIDTRSALEAGALLVLTARDLPFIEKTLISRFAHPSIREGMSKLLALDRVRFVGEAVALVVADDRYRAEDLAELVSVEYRPLPPIPTSGAVTAPNAYWLTPSSAAAVPATSGWSVSASASAFAWTKLQLAISNVSGSTTVARPVPGSETIAMSPSPATIIMARPSRRRPRGARVASRWAFTCAPTTRKTAFIPKRTP